MELVPANIALSFEVTYDRADLHVGMSVYDDSGPSPVLVAGPSAMTLVADYTYRGKYTAGLNKLYVIIKAVYTDAGLTILDPNYSQGSESIVARDLTPQVSESSGCGVIGRVDNNVQLIGRVICEN